MEWNDELIARLRMLWNEGLSTAEIGRRMCVSKNAVVGKAHRLGLAARPSPIRRDSSGTSTPRPAAPRRVVGPTLPPLAATLSSSPDVPKEERPQSRLPSKPSLPTPSHTKPPAPPTPTIASVAAPVRTVATRSSRLVTCCWPIGEPGAKTFRFCDEEALTGKPYCSEHVRLAYVKVRDRREEAA
jgi:GcrA cell cycle regulator